MNTKRYFLLLGITCFNFQNNLIAMEEKVVGKKHVRELEQDDIAYDKELIEQKRQAINSFMNQESIEERIRFEDLSLDLQNIIIRQAGSLGDIQSIRRVSRAFNQSIMGESFLRIRREIAQRASVGDIEYFKQLSPDFLQLLTLRYKNTGDTVLRIALRNGHKDLAKELIRLKPEVLAQAKSDFDDLIGVVLALNPVRVKGLAMNDYPVDFLNDALHEALSIERIVLQDLRYMNLNYLLPLIKNLGTFIDSIKSYCARFSQENLNSIVKGVTLKSIKVKMQEDRIFSASADEQNIQVPVFNILTRILGSRVVSSLGISPDKDLSKMDRLLISMVIWEYMKNSFNGNIILDIVPRISEIRANLERDLANAGATCDNDEDDFDSQAATQQE